MIILPFEKEMIITQKYSTQHTGMDIQGQTNKNVYAIAAGVVDYAGWENPNNQKQGFGLYVRVKSEDGSYYYYGHLNQIFVKMAEVITLDTQIGVEGNTGYVTGITGLHLHMEARKKVGDPATSLDISKIMGIPNQMGKIVGPSAYARVNWQRLVSNNILDGTDPDGNLTREQFAAVVDRLGLVK